MSRPTAAGPATRPSVLAGVRVGDSQAWSTFFEIYAPVVYRYARHAGLPDSDAEDVVASVMRNFVRALPNFTYDRTAGKFRHYLRRVANHEIAGQRRRKSRVLDLAAVPEVMDRAEPPDQCWADLERQERLRTCLETLRRSTRISPRDWLAFERFALQRQSSELVARELGISKSRLFAIKHETIEKLRGLRRELDDILGEV